MDLGKAEEKNITQICGLSPRQILLTCNYRICPWGLFIIFSFTFWPIGQDQMKNFDGPIIGPNPSQLFITIKPTTMFTEFFKFQILSLAPKIAVKNTVFEWHSSSLSSCLIKRLRIVQKFVFQ